MSALASLDPAETAAALAGPACAALVRQAAEAGVAEAQALLGGMLLAGDDVARDERAGFGWLLRAAAQGRPGSLAAVGRCYEHR